MTEEVETEPPRTRSTSEWMSLTRIAASACYAEGRARARTEARAATADDGGPPANQPVLLSAARVGILPDAMRVRFVLCCSICVVGLMRGEPLLAETAPPTRSLQNERVGYALSYPRRWIVTGQVVSTEFAARAACQSVRVVDNAGQAEVRQSFVQICWRRVTDRSSLDQFMRKIYRNRLSKLFGKTELGGVHAYRSRNGAANRTFFVQARAYRVQLVATVVAQPAARANRLAQVNRILASFTLKRL